MFFTIHVKQGASLTFYRTKIKHDAKQVIINFPEKATEGALNKYLLKNYKTTLKAACWFLVKKATISTNFDGDFIVTFRNKDWDDLASLITYGNGNLYGSPILREAFKLKKPEKKGWFYTWL